MLVVVGTLVLEVVTIAVMLDGAPMVVRMKPFVLGASVDVRMMSVDVVVDTMSTIKVVVVVVWAVVAFETTALRKKSKTWPYLLSAKQSIIYRVAVQLGETILCLD